MTHPHPRSLRYDHLKHFNLYGFEAIFDRRKTVGDYTKRQCDLTRYFGKESVSRGVRYNEAGGIDNDALWQWDEERYLSSYVIDIEMIKVRDEDYYTADSADSDFKDRQHRWEVHSCGITVHETEDRPDEIRETFKFFFNPRPKPLLWPCVRRLLRARVPVDSLHPLVLQVLPALHHLLHRRTHRGVDVVEGRAMHYVRGQAHLRQAPVPHL